MDMKEPTFNQNIINNLNSELYSFGLNSETAKLSRKKYGKNFYKTKQDSLWKKFLANLKEPMMILLIVAMVALIAMGLDSALSTNQNKQDVTEIISSFLEAGLIFVIIVFSVGLSLWQENKIKKASASLENLTNLMCVVVRDNQLKTIKSSDVLMGDLIVLTPNSIVPADAKLIQSKNLKIDESILVGHFLENLKNSNFISKNDTPIEKQFENVFQGTKVIEGFGLAIVTSIAKNTQLSILKQALITKPIQSVYLQKQISKLSIILGLIAGSICVAFFFLYILAANHYDSFSFNDNTWIKSLSVSISLAIATIPEGLLAIVTLILTGVANKMKSNNVLIKKMPLIVSFNYVDVAIINIDGLNLEDEYQIVNFEVDPNFNKEQKSSYLLSLWKLSNIHSHFNARNIDEFVGENNLVSCDKLDEFEVIENKLSDKYELLVLFNNQSKQYFYLIKQFDLLRNNKVNFINKNKQSKSFLKEVVENNLVPVCLSFYQSSKKITSVNEIFKLSSVFAIVALSNLKIDINNLKNNNIVPVIFSTKSKEWVSENLQFLDLNKNDILNFNEKYIGNISEIKVFCDLTSEQKQLLVKQISSNQNVVYCGGDNSDIETLEISNLNCVFSNLANLQTNNLADILIQNNSSSVLTKIVDASRKTLLNIKASLVLLLTANLTCLLTTLIGMLVFMVEPLSSIQLLVIDILAETIIGFPMMNNYRHEKTQSFKPRRVNEFVIDKKMLFKIVFFGLVISGLSLLMFYIGTSAFYHFNYNDMTNTVYGISISHLSPDLVSEYPFWHDNGLINFASYAGSSLCFMTLSLSLLFNGLCFRTNESIFKVNWDQSKAYVYVILTSSIVFMLINYVPYLNTTFGLEPYFFNKTNTGMNLQWLNILPYLSLMLVIGTHELFKVLVK